jgi:hypothetical protein
MRAARIHAKARARNRLSLYPMWRKYAVGKMRKNHTLLMATLPG